MFDATRMKELRTRAGLSQAALAKKSGLSLGSLRNWEQGRRAPSVAAVIVLAQAFGVPTADLLAAKGKKRT